MHSRQAVTFHLIYKHVLQVGAVEVNGSRVFHEIRNEISIAFQGFTLKVINACQRNIVSAIMSVDLWM